MTCQTYLTWRSPDVPGPPIIADVRRLGLKYLVYLLANCVRSWYLPRGSHGLTLDGGFIVLLVSCGEAYKRALNWYELLPLVGRFKIESGASFLKPIMPMHIGTHTTSVQYNTNDLLHLIRTPITRLMILESTSYMAQLSKLSDPLA